MASVTVVPQGPQCWSQDGHTFLWERLIVQRDGTSMNCVVTFPNNMRFGLKYECAWWSEPFRLDDVRIGLGR